jgi:hypothetical protein
MMLGEHLPIGQGGGDAAALESGAHVADNYANTGGATVVGELGARHRMRTRSIGQR